MYSNVKTHHTQNSKPLPLYMLYVIDTLLCMLYNMYISYCTRMDCKYTQYLFTYTLYYNIICIHSYINIRVRVPWRAFRVGGREFDV